MGDGWTRIKCAHGGDGAQRAEVVSGARVGERAEQETHKKEVPGGSRGGPDGSWEGPRARAFFGGGIGIVKLMSAPFRAFEIALSLYYLPRAAQRARWGRNAFCGICVFLGKWRKDFLEL